MKIVAKGINFPVIERKTSGIEYLMKRQGPMDTFLTEWTKKMGEMGPKNLKNWLCMCEVDCAIDRK